MSFDILSFVISLNLYVAVYISGILPVTVNFTSVYSLNPFEWTPTSNETIASVNESCLTLIVHITLIVHCSKLNYHFLVFLLFDNNYWSPTSNYYVFNKGNYKIVFLYYCNHSTHRVYNTSSRYSIEWMFNVH